MKRFDNMAAWGLIIGGTCLLALCALTAPIYGDFRLMPPPPPLQTPVFGHWLGGSNCVPGDKSGYCHSSGSKRTCEPFQEVLRYCSLPPACENCCLCFWEFPGAKTLCSCQSRGAAVVAPVVSIAPAQSNETK